MRLKIDNIVACILDMDGVVTDTARLHALAWQKMFDDFLAEYAHRRQEKIEPFDVNREYRKYLDGKPRYDGVESFLDVRNISLPYGDPDDSPEKETICGLGNRKNRHLHNLLEEESVDVFDSTIAFIKKGRVEVSALLFASHRLYLPIFFVPLSGCTYINSNH